MEHPDRANEYCWSPPQTLKNFDFFPPDEQEMIVSLRPGLTGIGSIVFRDEEKLVAALDKPLERIYSEDIGPYKAELEKWYANHQSILNYWLLIIVTAWVIFVPASTVYRKLWPALPPMPASLKPGSA